MNIKEWNEKYPIGTRVIVTRDNGLHMPTKTRSEAWLLGDHAAVIQVEGIAGCYRLDRIEPLERIT